MANHETITDARKMRPALADDQLAAYRRDGFLFLEQVFSASEVATMLRALGPLMAERSERTVYEVNSETIRSVYGVHQHSAVFAALARHPRLLGPVCAALAQDVYVYQSKINTKSVFGGDLWPWHQDYIFWRNEDGMKTPRALTVAVFLDEVTEVNGPLSLIPGAHVDGVLDTVTREGRPSGYDKSPDWIANVVASLKYTIAKPTFVRLAQEKGIVTPKGPAGSVLIFDSNAPHASSINLSPFERRMVLFTYNAVDNAPPEAALHRPEFLASRDTRPVLPGRDDALVALASADLS